MKKTVETQTEFKNDNESAIEFVRITLLHPRESLKRKVARLITHKLFIFSDGFSQLL